MSDPYKLSLRSYWRHDYMDAGGRVTHGAVAEEARTELSRYQLFLILEKTV